MSSNIILSTTPGPTLTAAARASCLPAGTRITLPTNFFYSGRALRLKLSGRISCAVTTPGTGRFDVCLGAAGTTIVYDTQPFNLNTNAKTDVPWLLDILLTCVGITPTITLFIPEARFMSEAVIGSPAPAAGGSGLLLFSTAPLVGPSNYANVVDVFFTQTVATGSLTVTTYQLDAISSQAGGGYNFE
jgi:hypothetical protein